jgi:RNA polymerase sigma-70 factor (ECF subfamily)
MPGLFTEFFIEWEPQVRRYLVWLEGDLSIIEDAAQETMISAFRYWARLSTLEQPRAWLFKVARQRLVDAQEERARLGALAEPSEVLASFASKSEIPACDDRLHILEAVRRLPPQQGAATALQIQYDLPLQEIADIMGVSVGSVKKHLHLARQSLRRWLSEEEGESYGA